MINVNNITASYSVNGKNTTALDNIDLSIRENIILGIAGESGSGKTTLLKILYGNIDDSLKILNGNISYKINGFEADCPNDYNLLRKYWWDLFSYIPQGSMSVLNPVKKIKNQFYDSPISKKYNKRNQLYYDLVEYLNSLQLDEKVLDSYPHQLSGGMRQRVIIALATFHSPKYIFADEPTTALDVVIQKEVLVLLKKVHISMKNTVVLVSHDLGVHFQLSDYLIILYLGEIVEISETSQLFSEPLHPYSKILIDSLPQIGDSNKRIGLDGALIENISYENGCKFAHKCPNVMDICKKEKPTSKQINDQKSVSCFLY